MSSCHLKVQGLGSKLGDFRLEDIDFSVRRGGYHMLLGPTGSGKSTLLKNILGIYHPQKGKIFLNSKDITIIPPEKRSMAYVPQNYALFAHLNVEQNVRFGLRARSIPSAEADKLVERLFRILKIERLKEQCVRRLSGGEKQKVALGRALATRPEIILLDEPFSSVDEGAKRLLWFELKQVMREVGITAIHITHNLEEAYTLGEKLSVLIDGKLVQSGEKKDIFERPVTEKVAEYLNYRNIFSGLIEERAFGCSVNLGHFDVNIKEKVQLGQRATICIRPQDIKIIREGVPVRDSLARNMLSGEVVSLFLFPDSCMMLFRIEASPRQYDFELKFPAYIRQRHNLFVGKKIRVAIWEPNIIIFKEGEPHF